MGPVGGIICCGLIFDKFGGYNGQKALPILCFVLTGGSVAAAFSLTPENEFFCTAMIVVELFAGGFCSPVITGMMLN